MSSSRQGKKLSETLIQKIKLLAANRVPYRTISDVTSVSVGSISKYCKGITLLPVNQCKNPFEVMSEKDYRKIEVARARTAENMTKAKMIGDIDFLIEQHLPGDRFEGPLDKVSLPDLQRLMETPTDYKSPLSLVEWMIYYLEGKEAAFLRFHPHKWSKMQLEMFGLWQQHKRLMYECFRDAGKTMVADAILLYEICENPDNNYFIMSETKEKAADRVKHIGDMLLSNKKRVDLLFRDLKNFGDDLGEYF